MMQKTLLLGVPDIVKKATAKSSYHHLHATCVVCPLQGFQKDPKRGPWGPLGRNVLAFPDSMCCEFWIPNMGSFLILFSKGRLQNWASQMTFKGLQSGPVNKASFLESFQKDRLRDKCQGSWAKVASQNTYPQRTAGATELASYWQLTPITESGYGG